MTGNPKTLLQEAREAFYRDILRCIVASGRLRVDVNGEVRRALVYQRPDGVWVVRPETH